MQAGLSTAILQDQAEATRLSLAERITRVVWLDRLLAASFVSLYIAFVAFGFGYHQDWRLHRGIEVLVHTSHIWPVLCACALLVSAATVAVAQFFGVLTLSRYWRLLVAAVCGGRATLQLTLGLADISSTKPLLEVALSFAGIAITVLPIMAIARFKLWRAEYVWIAVFLGFCSNSATRLTDSSYGAQGAPIALLPAVEACMLYLYTLPGSLSLWLEGYAYCLLVIKWGHGSVWKTIFWIFFFSASVSVIWIYFNIWNDFDAAITLKSWLAAMVSIFMDGVLLSFAILYLRWSEHSFQAASEYEFATAESNRTALESRLQALKAQLEPHFLFNTLANVKRLYGTAPHTAKTLLASLNNYLRIAIPKLRDGAHTLGSELMLTSSYLDILQSRMGARLTYRLQVPEALHQVIFPSTLLLTLVENAIKHGLMSLPQGGSIDVEAIAEQGLLHVSVRDTGRGFSVTDAGGTGVGIANVRERLAAQYGALAHLQLTSNHPQGVIATITLPYQPHFQNQPQENTAA